jgi:hypothetical protein
MATVPVVSVPMTMAAMPSKLNISHVRTGLSLLIKNAMIWISTQMA